MVSACDLNSLIEKNIRNPSENPTLYPPPISEPEEQNPGGGDPDDSNTSGVPVAILLYTPTDGGSENYLDTYVEGDGIVNYRYKYGPSVSTNCNLDIGYSAVQSVDDGIFHDISMYDEVELKLCVLGIDSLGTEQELNQATEFVWTRVVPTYVYFASSGETFTEGVASLTFKFFSTKPAGIPIIIDYDIYGDLVGIMNYQRGSVTILSGQNEATLVLPVNSNPSPNTDKRVTVGITNLNGAYRIDGTLSLSSQLILDAQRPVVGVLDIKSNCAILTDGKLVCTGDIGGPTSSTRNWAYGYRNIIPGVSFKKIISAGYVYIAQSVDDELYSWGWGFNGDLGLGSGADKKVPEKINGFVWNKVEKSGVQCGITVSEDLYCWGDHTYTSGALGIASSADARSPAQVEPGNKFIDIFMYGNSNCAIEKTTHALKCWGSNYGNILGTGNSTNPNVPVIIDSGVQYKQVKFGYNYTVGLTTAGAIKIWGDNPPISQYASPTPVLVDESRNYSRIVIAGPKLICFLTDQDDLYCLGNYGGNNLGFDEEFVLPTLIDEGDKYSKFVSTGDIGCGLTYTNKVKCFWHGWSYYSSLLPKGPEEWASGTYSDIIADETRGRICVLDATSFPKCIFSNTHDPAPSYASVLSDSTFNIRQAWYDYILDENFKVYTFTHSGANTTGAMVRAVDFPTDQNIKFLSNRGNCFINTSDKLFCRGFYRGDGGSSTGYESQFVSVLPDKNIVAVQQLTFSYQNTCALTDQKELYCWGLNSYGEMGKGDIVESNTPTLVMSQVIDFDTGVALVCAINESFELYCWGTSSSGIGNGSTSSFSPTRIGGTDLFTKVKSGRVNCAIRQDNGRVMCWGATYGIGNGSSASRATPTLTSDTDSYQKIFAYGSGTCGVTSGIIRCWGEFAGLGTLVPVLVHNGDIKFKSEYIVSPEGKLFGLGWSTRFFGQQGFPFFEPFLGLVDRSIPDATF